VATSFDPTDLFVGQPDEQAEMIELLERILEPQEVRLLRIDMTMDDILDEEIAYRLKVSVEEIQPMREKAWSKLEDMMNGDTGHTPPNADSGADSHNLAWPIAGLAALGGLNEIARAAGGTGEAASTTNTALSNIIETILNSPLGLAFLTLGVGDFGILVAILLIGLVVVWISDQSNVAGDTEGNGDKDGVTSSDKTEKTMVGDSSDDEVMMDKDDLAEHLIENMNGKTVLASDGERYRVILKKDERTFREYTVEIHGWLRRGDGQTTSLSFPVMTFIVKAGKVNINMDLRNQVWEETQLPAKLGGKKLSFALFSLLGDSLPSKIKLAAANRHVETRKHLAARYYVDAQGNVRKKIGNMINEANDLIVVDKREDTVDHESEISVYTVMAETLFGYLVKNYAGFELISIEINRMRNVEALRYLLLNFLSPKEAESSPS